MKETGLSDSHKIIAIAFKTSFEKIKPRIISYRGYNNIDNNKVRENLWQRRIKNPAKHVRWSYL